MVDVLNAGKIKKVSDCDSGMSGGSALKKCIQIGFGAQCSRISIYFRGFILRIPMKVEFDIPDALAIEMKNHTSVNWNHIITQTIDGFLHDLTILNKLKDFWGVKQAK